MALPFRFWLGGTLGVARSWRSWIHIDDEVGLLIHAIENSNIAGPINLTAPNPVRASEFSRRLGRALHRPSWLPAPEFALRLVFGKNTETITRGLKVLPRKALEVGYSFQFPNLAPALSQLFQR
jgi:uncharacterized protein (TIGR01777 family)